MTVHDSESSLPAGKLPRRSRIPAMAHRLLSRVVRGAAFGALVRGIESLSGSAPGVLRILTYHRIAEPNDPADLHPGLVSATPAEFEQQIAWIAGSCRAVTAQEALAAFESRTALPPRSVWITFDDAYDDFASRAWPVLERYGLPVTLFVPTAFPGDPNRVFWWDRLHRALRGDRGGGSSGGAARRAVERRLLGLPYDEAMSEISKLESEHGSAAGPNRVLSWPELRRLAGGGVALAPHSRTHPILNRISAEDAVSEAVGSLRDLEREVGDVPKCFAYPGGVYPEGTPERLRDAGFTAGVTARRGTNAIGSADPLHLRRINVGLATSLSLLRAQLVPWVHIAAPLFDNAGPR